MLLTERLFIRLPEHGDIRLLKQFEEKNRDQFKRHNESYELIVGNNEWDKQLTVWIDDCHKQRAIRFLVFSKESKNHLIAIVHYTNVIRGSLQACYLGYQTDYEFASLGLIIEALQASVTYIFHQYNLHRIIATYQPNNNTAGHILKTLGFRVEGYAYDFLLTESGWQDHILTSLVNTDWQGN